MERRITTGEIARLAGVSRSTVSRVLNNVKTCSISEPVRQRIREIAETHDFEISQAGLSLVSRRSFKLGILLDSLEFDFTSPYTSQILSAFLRETVHLGYLSIIQPVSGKDLDALVLKTVRAGNADGYWIGNGMIGSRTLLELARRNLPVVCSYLDANAEVNLPGVENFRLELDAAFHTFFALLRERGFRRYAFVEHIHPNLTTMTRYSHYAIGAEYGMTEGMRVRFHSSPNEYLLPESARRHAAARWEELRHYDLILCCNDMCAFGVMGLLRDQGITPGKEISVVGFDNFEDSILFRCGFDDASLATFDIPWREIGRAMARRLVERIEKSDSGFADRHFPVKFVLRDSLGFPAKIVSE